MKRRIDAALRPGSHVRTNQFEVSRQLDGLQEKFQVLNRDELADALRDCRAELDQCRSPWSPELLAFLQQLSDRPAQLSNFEPTHTIDTAEGKKLTWNDLDTQGAAYSDEDIWEEIDFGDGSSDEDIASVSSDTSFSKPLLRTPKTPDREYKISPEVFVSGDDEQLLASIKQAQFWSPENYSESSQSKINQVSSRVISESQLARETIFMLRGLPTSIFWRLDQKIEVDHRYTLAHSSTDAISALLSSFTDIGAKVDVLRQFAGFSQTIPYMQTFRRGLEERLSEFDKTLSQKECQYLSPGSTVSLLRLFEDVRESSKHLVMVAGMVSSLDQDSKPMCCLDLLYEFVCMLEALGDISGYETFAALFFSCFETYAQSIQLWMETGQVDPLGTSFFVRELQDNGDLRTLWHDWYALSEGPQHQNIPRFLEPGVDRIFTTGKSMVFLRHLNAVPEVSESSINLQATIQSACRPGLVSSVPLPFSALVESAFEKMIEAYHAISSRSLRTELDERCGLWKSIDALEHVYLGKDSSVLSSIDTKIFDLMDRGRAWDDKFLLTELIRSSFGVIRSFDASRLVVRTEGMSRNDDSSNRSVRVLQSTSIDYILPWPVANIITNDATEAYQCISTFLMQIRRAKYALVRQHLRDSRAHQSEKSNNLVFALHHNLLWFLDTVYAHFTLLVISSESQSFRSALSQTEDVDAMIAAHQSYLSTLADQCLLLENLSPIHEAIINILDLCIYFADLQAAHAFETTASEDGIIDSRFTPGVQRPEKKDEDSDSDEDKDDLDHEQTLTISFRDDPYDLRIKNVKIRFEHLLSFVADGLKGVARADGLPSWNILAERLEWRRASVKF